MSGGAEFHVGARAIKGDARFARAVDVIAVDAEA